MMNDGAAYYIFFCKVLLDITLQHFFLTDIYQAHSDPEHSVKPRVCLCSGILCGLLQ